MAKGVFANSYGFFSINVQPDSILLEISHVGYKEVLLDLIVKKDTSLIIYMNPDNQLEEILVTNENNKTSVNSALFNQLIFPLTKIDMIPVIGSEPDIMKGLQLLPGIKGGREGGGSIHVRGSGPGQNLILLDDVPVYNINHLFGFFSVFNPDAIKHVKVIKGGFPARYGGRLSSVVDIQMKEGNQNKIAGKASVGLISSRLTIEVPVFTDCIHLNLIFITKKWIILLLIKKVIAIYLVILTGYQKLRLADKENQPG